MAFPLIPIMAGLEALKLAKQTVESALDLGKSVQPKSDQEDIEG